MQTGACIFVYCPGHDSIQGTAQDQGRSRCRANAKSPGRVHRAQRRRSRPPRLPYSRAAAGGCPYGGFRGGSRGSRGRLTYFPRMWWCRTLPCSWGRRRQTPGPLALWADDMTAMLLTQSGKCRGCRGRALGPGEQNFFCSFDFCVTYRYPGTSMIEAQGRAGEKLCPVLLRASASLREISFLLRAPWYIFCGTKPKGGRRWPVAGRQ